jgi:hypothetical protein
MFCDFLFYLIRPALFQGGTKAKVVLRGQPPVCAKRFEHKKLKNATNTNGL